jgi:hypothetical protein
LFGNGKSGKNSLTKQFEASPQLVSACQTALASKSLSELVSNEILEKNPREFFSKIYNIRGSLHHPNSKKSLDWNPNRQRDFKDFTLMLAHVCIEVAVRRSSERLFVNPNLERGMKKIERCIRLGKPVAIHTS